MSKLRVVVFFSGTGSTLKALIDGGQQYEIITTICNNPDAAGIQHTIDANIPCHIIDHKKFSDKAAYEQEILRCLSFYDFDLIALAGYMRVLSPEFVEQFSNKIINIHPSLLPKYQGLNTYARALAAGEKEHGTTIHYVTAEVDAGEIIAQERVSIEDEDDAESLAAKTKAIEQVLYPQILNQYSSNFCTK